MTSAQDIDRHIEWIDTVRAMHRRKRICAYIACALGIGLIFWGKFGSAEIGWTLPVGLSIIIASWLVFVFIAYDKWRWTKNNAFKP